MGNKIASSSTKKSLIGGQALMEGVMMRGVKSEAMAVRSPDGQILIESRRHSSGKKRLYRKIPVIRGLAAFFTSLVSGVRCIIRSAEVCAPEEETPSSFMMGIAVFLGLAMGIGLFILLPSFINSLVIDRLLDDNILLSSIVEGVLRIAIFVVYLLLVSLLNDIRRTFMYHGAEHKTISCFEKGDELTVENIQKCSTVHNRCGTTFLFFVMLVSILLFSLFNWLFSLWGITTASFGTIGTAFIKMGVRLALLPLVAGLSYELLRFLAWLPDNILVKILRAPGLALQKLSTKQPTDDMVEVALKSFLEVCLLDEHDQIPTIEFGQLRLDDAKNLIRDSLKNTNADSCEIDWILCDVLKMRRSEINSVNVLSVSQVSALNKILARRSKNEPLNYILGYTDFYKNRIALDKNVLIPRMETELLCERAIDIINEKIADSEKDDGKKTDSEKDNSEKSKADLHKISALDLCTGSACIALALAKNTNAKIVASDISQGALDIAQKNLQGTDVILVCSNMFENLQGQKFDVIVCNPPYIESDVIATLDAEVKNFEPLGALDGGKDGLDFYRILAQSVKEHINENGVLLMEIGYNQGESVKSIFGEICDKIDCIKDYSSNDRIVVCKF